MLVKYFKDLFSRFKKTKPITKFLVFFLILVELFFIFISFYQVEYTVITPGGLSYAQSVVSVVDGNTSGNVYTVSVFEYRETSLIQYWLAKNDNKLLLESWEDDVLDEDMQTKYGIISKKMAINNAIMVAYEKASEKDSSIFLAKTYKGCIVCAVTNNKTDVKPDDIITKINGEKITSLDDFDSKLASIISTAKEGDYIKFTCITEENDTEIEKNVALMSTENGLKCGLVLADYYYLDGENSTPKFTTNYNPKTDGTGGSGGAMLTLAIYNQLIEEDITYGLNIVGTGTISIDGKVGIIGGIRQKLTKVYLAKAPVFFVCAENYDEAIEACNEYGYDSSFVYRVETFDDILNILEEIHERSDTNE